MAANDAIDLDALGRATNFDDIWQREDKKDDLRRQKTILAGETAIPDLVMRVDPVGTFFRGTKALGNILAGGVEDVGLGLSYPATGQPPNLENLRHALTEWTPTPTEEALAQERGVGAALTRGGIGAIKTAPILAAGGVVTAATKLPLYVVYPGLFGTEAYEHTAPEELEKAGLPPMSPMERAYEVTKAAAIGALYPLVGTWVKPVASKLIVSIGAAGNPTAQKAIETVVDQALMQSVTEVITVAEYAARTQEAPKSPEELAELMVESFGNIVLFTVPRVLGYARGRPSEYEVELRRAIAEEKVRLRNIFLQQGWKKFQQAINAAETPGAKAEDLQAAAMRAGLIRAQPDRGLTVEQRQAEERAAAEAERADIERSFTEATHDPMAAYRPKLPESIKGALVGRGTTPGRRLAAQFAEEEAGTPVTIGVAKVPEAPTLPVPDILNQSPEGIPFGDPFIEFRRAQGRAAGEWMQKLEPGIYEGINEDGGIDFNHIEVTRRRDGTIQVLAIGEGGVADLTSGSELTHGQATTREGKRIWVRGIRLRKKGTSDASTIRSDQTKPAKAGKTDETGKTDSGGDLEPRPPGQAGGEVQPRPEAQVIPKPQEGDIVELYGYVGEFGKDAEGRTVIKTDTGLVEVPEGASVTLRLTVTPEGKIVRNGVLFEPSVGGGQPWTNAYNRENGWLRIRKVGDGVRLVLSGPTADWVVARLTSIQPPRTPRRSLRVPKLPEEATETGLAEGETMQVDTPVDEYILGTGIAKEADQRRAVAARDEAELAAMEKQDKAERVAATVTLRNNIAIELPELQLERYRRKGGDPHTGEIKPARIIYNNKGPSASYIEVRGQKAYYSYRVPLSALPEGSWKKIEGGIQFDKRALLAFLNDDVRRFANRNQSNRGEYFVPKDIDAITGVTTMGRPGLPGRRVRLDQPVGEGGKTLESVLDVPNPATEEIRRPITGIARRALDGLRDKNVGLFRQLIDRRYEELDETFWNSVKAEIMQLDEFKALPEAIDVLHASDAMVKLFQQMKESGRLNEQAAFSKTGKPGETPIPTFGLGRGTIAMFKLGMREFDVGRYEKWLQYAKGLSEAEARTQSVRVLSELNDWQTSDKPPTPTVREAVGWHQTEVGRRVAGEPMEDQTANLRDARALLDNPSVGLSEEAKAILRDMLDSPIAAYLNGRQIRIRIADDVGSGFQATYSPVEQMISISRYAHDSTSGASEFFHALWEMIQDSDRRNVEIWRQQAIAHTMRTATGKDLELLQRLAKGEEISSGHFVAFEYNPKLYPLRSAEEYFAETFTDRWAKDRIGIWGQAKEIYASQDSFLSRIRQIIEVILDSIRRRIPGLATEAERLQRTILSGKYDVLPTSENVPGVRFVTKNAVVTAPGVRPRAAITAHHGTPHQVERFATERIGTGEGAQVYGWGIYASERLEVAESYRTAFATGAMPSTGNLYTVRLDVKPGDLLDWDKPLNQQGESVRQALARDPKLAEYVNNPTGPQPTGHDIYRTLQSIKPVFKSSNPMQMASEYLLSLGIPGIKYLDQWSRATVWNEANVGVAKNGYTQKWSATDPRAGRGGIERNTRAEAEVDAEAMRAEYRRLESERERTSNFVIFDESKIHITHENGQEVPLREAMGEPREQPQLLPPEPKPVTGDIVTIDDATRYSDPQFFNTAHLPEAGFEPMARRLQERFARLGSDHLSAIQDAQNVAEDFKRGRIAWKTYEKPGQPPFTLFRKEGGATGILEGRYRPQERGIQAALESEQAIQKFVEPLEETETPERFRRIASTVNSGLVSQAAADRFFALPASVNLELKNLFTGRIGTQQPDTPSFRDAMKDPNSTPEEKSDLSRYGLIEWQGYQFDRKKIINRQENAARVLDDLTRQAIESIPSTNEAELRASISLGTVLDRIKAEREATAQGAQSNELREGIDHLDALNDLLGQPLAMARALRGISDIVGRAELLDERRGEEVLNLISERAGYPTADTPTPHTPTQWVRGLAHHLDQMRDGDRRRVNASEDVIEATLWMLRLRGDWRQELLEAQMTEDGTLRRFNADYMNDLRSRVPQGFNGVLSRYARHEAEARALRSAANRLNRKIISLEERKNNLDQAVAFIRQHDSDPDFIDFGKAVVETTGAISGIVQTENGYTITLKHPLNGTDVTLDFGFNKAESKENIRRIIELDEAGMQYSSRPDANPVDVAFWKDFNQRVRHELPVMDPGYARLADPLLDPLNILTGGLSRLLAHSIFGLIVESTMARLPGPLPHKTGRAMEAFGIALKTKNAFDKDAGQRAQNANEIAWRSHQKIPGDRVSTVALWRDEVAGLIIDKRQHFGQNQYRVGQRIAGFGHIITSEDMKAVEAQYKYDQFLVRLAFKSGYIPAVAEAPGRVKDTRLKVLRFPLSQGPGTVTRYLPEESRRLPDEWATAVERFQVDEFLGSSDNFIRTVLGHVIEDERNYFDKYRDFANGKYSEDYKSIRASRDDLQRSGEMPNNMNDLAQMIADLHNRHLKEGEEPSTMSDVRRQLIDEVSVYMKEVAKDNNERKQTEARIDIISHENEYSQPRAAKIAPGTLYRYGVTDKIDMIRKGNNAVEFYVVRYRDLLRKTQDALLDQKRKVVDTLRSEYGGEGWKARQQFRKGIIAGDDPRLQKHQMTVREIDSNIDRIGKLLQNANDIIRRREEYYGDDIANRLFHPWLNSAVGSVLLSPRAWLTNMGSGDAMWALKAAEIRRGGWLGMPAVVIKDHLTGYMKSIIKARVPKNAKERAYKKMLEDNPALYDGVAEHLTGILQYIQDREALKRTGVIDSHSYKDAFGWDTDRPMAENLKGIVDALIEIKAEPNLSARKEIFNYIGMIPRGFNLGLARKIGMRNVDNWINARSIIFASAMAETLRTQAVKSFDGRMEHDPVFRQAFEQYGDNFDRFYLQLMRGAEKGVLLTPAELTGRWTPASALSVSKAAVQLRRQFSRNNDPVDWLMLKYWWNKRAANGDRNAPFMDPQQRLALHVSLAEDVNMATPSSRPTYFMGSKERQMVGVLSQWWLWNLTRLQDIFSKVKGQKTGGVRYLPGAIAFLFATAAAGLVYTSTGQKLNELAFNAVGNQPNIWDAENDDDKLRIITSLAANYWGMVGSFYKAATDTPGKLGYRNPVFYLNMANDFISAGMKIWSSGDFQGPVLDLTARYVPPLRAAINRMPSRQGLLEVRDAANLLRAATPETLEAKRRAPISGPDIRATPMTPLYNAILNAAAVGDWAAADESFEKAVELARASGAANPEQSIVSAIRSRSPETAVYTRALANEERDLVYSRLNPANLEKVERTNRVFDDIASRYGTGGGGGGRVAGGARTAGIAPRSALGGFLSGGMVGIASGRALSLAPRGVRTGFRTRSLQRGLRTRSLLRGIRRPSVGGRLRRLAI